jgi:ATP/maltotriose-dependent transcriptional regulator MalT
MLDRALPAVPPDSPLRVSGLAAAGALAILRGEVGRAHELLGEAYDLARRNGDRAEIARVSEPLTHCLRMLGRLDAANAVCVEGLEIARATGEGSLERELTSCLAQVTWDRSGPEAARPHMARALGLARGAGDRRLAARMLIGLSQVELFAGNLDAARDDVDAGLALAYEIDDFFDQHFGHWVRALIAQARGRHEEARTECLAAIRLVTAARNLYGLPFALETLAHLALQDGTPGRAARLLGAAEGIRAAGDAVPVPASEQVRAALLAGLREVLGEESLAAARHAGRAMVLDEIVAYAAGADDGVPVPAPSGVDSTAARA